MAEHIADWQSQLDQARRTKTANIICMKWGTRYGPHWVNRLYGMIQRNTSWNIRFVCFTDDATGIRDDVECQPMPQFDYDPSLGKYWPKLGMMQDTVGGLTGMTLFLDLDLIILDNIDAFLEHDGRFNIIREWKNPHLGFGNSSVVRFFVGQESAVIDRFHATSHADLASKYDNKEQNFLTKEVDEVAFWPDDWCVPFPLACLPRNRVVRFFSKAKPPTTGKILIFYGSITPESALLGQHQGNKRTGDGYKLRLTKRRFGAADWITTLWRE